MTTEADPPVSRLGWIVEKFLVPIVVGIAAAGTTIFVSNIEQQGALRTEAAAIAMSGDPTVAEVQGRIETLAIMFPNELKGWLPSEEKQGKPDYLFPSANSGRWAFFQQVMTKIDCPEQVAALWDHLFGPERQFQPSNTGDVWAGTLRLPLCPDVSADDALGADADS